MNSKDFYSLTTKTIEGDSYSFSELKGKKVLIVNTASECGLTPQYEQLQELYDSEGGDDFMIIGFPSNDFGAQEPGSEGEIAEFCQKNYGVTFPMMSKVVVTGTEKCEVYQWLTSKELNGVSDYTVEWNFHKFLIDENGKMVNEKKPQVLPIDESILTWIQK
ncbi:MAG: glutathione peroxidase [Flavobacteriales bacterium]